MADIRYAFAGKLKDGRWTVCHGYIGYPMSRQFVDFHGEYGQRNALAWAQWWIGPSTGYSGIDTSGRISA